ncbi:MAG TPA: DUF2177 family protein [Caulobacter sp.]|nr:DUF2177 family protein [Caulobacter sp.]
MLKYVAAYIASGVVFIALDFVWLAVIAQKLYQREIGPLLLEKPNMAAAAPFYLLYLGATVFFAVRPALAAGSWTTALVHGAIFGFAAYATYDLTNMATLKGFSWAVVAADLAWGAFVTAAVATAGYFGASLIKA